MPSKQLLKGRAYSLSRVNVGDVVVRYLAGALRIELTMTEVTLNAGFKNFRGEKDFTLFFSKIRLL
jgi:hypothetical protein